MRHLCLVICLSLLTSLLHAASMPLLQSASDKYQKTAIEQVSFDCHEHQEVLPKDHMRNPCHGNLHQCCLGFLMQSPVIAVAVIRYTSEFSAGLQTGKLEDFIHSIYRPPKSLMRLQNKSVEM